MINKQDVLNLIKDMKSRISNDLYSEADETVLDILANKIEGMEEVGEWIPAVWEVPADDNYVLLSFENYPVPAIGRYEEHEDGSGNWYPGDCDGEDTCLAVGLFVNAWMPLPPSYKGDRDDVIKIIENQPKVGEWIPVSAAAPEEDVDVLLLLKDQYENYYYTIACHHIVWQTEVGGMYSKPVAWMPLPELYKEEA